MRVEKLQIVISVELRDDLPRHLDEAFVGIAKELKGRLFRPPQIPQKLPPEIPRLILHAPNVVAQVGLNRLEVVLRPPSHVAGEIEPSIKFFEALLSSSLKPAIGRVELHEWLGAVLTLHYPMQSLTLSAANGVKDVARKLVNIPVHPEDLSMFKLHYGYKHGRFFRHVLVDGYETREWIEEIGMQEQLPLSLVPPKSVPVTEAGVQLSLDVNNKPATDRQNTSAELKLVLLELSTFQNTVWEFLGVKF